jgi:hypothetical protein
MGISLFVAPIKHMGIHRYHMGIPMFTDIQTKMAHTNYRLNRGEYFQIAAPHLTHQ